VGVVAIRRFRMGRVGFGWNVVVPAGSMNDGMSVAGAEQPIDSLSPLARTVRS